MRIERWRRICFGIGLVGLMGVTGCGVSSVRSVHDHPQRHWFNSVVELEGTVIDRVPLIESAVYQLQDETGQIWILTTDSELSPGERLLVRGRVRFESISIEGQELGEAYIEEEKREAVPDDRG